VNGDGFDDVIVGAPNFRSSPSMPQEGAAFLYLGSASGLEPSPSWTTVGNQPGAHLGESVSTAGDVNGDGYADIIVGSQSFNGDQLNERRALVFLGSAGGPSLAPDWTVDGNHADSEFGSSVSAAGDVNGDGLDDVIVGAPSYSNGQAGEGRALLYLGSPSGLATSPAWATESDLASTWLGYRVAAAGDVNGDGFADIAVTSPSYSNSEANEGRAWVFLGSAAGLASNPAWAFETNQAGGSILPAASAGDVNRDGYGDLIVGASGYLNHGRAYLFLGSGSGLSSFPIATVEIEQPLASFGYSASTAGDIDGDGFEEVLIGAVGYNNGEEAEGGAFVYSWSRVPPSARR
jgi:hypothetical protein